jgi:hypothetical protein
MNARNTQSYLPILLLPGHDLPAIAKAPKHLKNNARTADFRRNAPQAFSTLFFGYRFSLILLIPLPCQV